MSKALRRKMVDELAAKFEGQKNLVVVDADGLTAGQATELRAALREDRGGMRHVKNSVALHTFKKLGIEGFEEKLSGMVAVVYGPDPLALAKKLVTFREKAQKPAVKGAMVEGKLVDSATVEELSKLGSREEILGSFLAALNAVAQKFVATLNEVPRSFVGTLQAVADKDKKD